MKITLIATGFAKTAPVNKPEVKKNDPAAVKAVAANEAKEEKDKDKEDLMNLFRRG